MMKRRVRRRLRNNMMGVILDSVTSRVNRSIEERTTSRGIDDATRTAALTKRITLSRNESPFVFDGDSDNDFVSRTESPFAQFVFDADSDDEREDEQETDLWRCCQNINSTKSDISHCSVSDSFR